MKDTKPEAPAKLLRELLEAFGLSQAPRNWLEAVGDSTRKRARVGVPAGPEGAALYHRELEDAGPILGVLRDRLRRLQRPPLPTPKDYGVAWASIINEWNQA